MPVLPVLLRQVASTHSVRPHNDSVTGVAAEIPTAPYRAIVFTWQEENSLKVFCKNQRHQL